VADWIGNRNELRNSHLRYVINKNDAAHTYIWEIEMKVYDGSYPLDSTPDTAPLTLTVGKKMGFAVAYCDNDNNAHSSNPTQIGDRDHFIGSMFVTGNTDNERNVAYQNSNQYAKIYLKK
ncbi:sugar-binding protein, partial [Treponema sp. R80B11-R83G3]